MRKTKEVIDYIEKAILEIVNNRIHLMEKDISNIVLEWKRIKTKIAKKMTEAKDDLLQKFTGIQSGCKYQSDVSNLYLYIFDEEVHPDL